MAGGPATAMIHVTLSTSHAADHSLDDIGWLGDFERFMAVALMDCADS